MLGTLKNALNLKVLGIIFSIFTILVAWCIGSSVQANAIASAITEQINLSPSFIGIIIASIAGFVIIGGIKQISKFCSFLVPIMSLLYIVSCLYILISNCTYIPNSIAIIVKSAFSTKSFIGGVAGSSIMLSFRIGISRGLFTNEAGLGSIPMAAASSNSSSSVNQGLISMTGPFWDTVVICAMTGLVIVSGMVKNPIKYIGVAPDKLCFVAFQEIPYVGSIILTICLVLFAFATIIGWCYYGECGVKFLCNKKIIHTTNSNPKRTHISNTTKLRAFSSTESYIKIYEFIYIMFIYLGSILSLDIVWSITDVINAFMAIPNIISIWLLRKVIIKDFTK